MANRWSIGSFFDLETQLKGKTKGRAGSWPLHVARAALSSILVYPGKKVSVDSLRKWWRMKGENVRVALSILFAGCLWDIPCAVCTLTSKRSTCTNSSTHVGVDWPNPIRPHAPANLCTGYIWPHIMSTYWPTRKLQRQRRGPALR